MELKNIKNLISNCPIVEIEYKYKNKVRKLYAECAWYSLTGSIKDRVAYQIINDAYNCGKLKSGDRIVEVSSGNMGISLVAVANLTNNPMTIIMPKTMSRERKQLLKMYGATLVEVENFNEAFKICDRYEKLGYFCTHQFDNESNIKAHYEITGDNIINRLKVGKINNFVAGIGTSGSLMGVGKRLKEYSKNINVMALEPENARIISGVKPMQSHKLQGLSDEILPSLYDKNLVDKVLQVSDNDAIAMAQKLNRELSLGVGISSGANFIGCILAGDNNSLTIFADDNKKYLSTDLSRPIETDLVKGIELVGCRYI